MEWSLYDTRGRRKHLTSSERRGFLRAALVVGGETATFCFVLALSGARVSEVLQLTPERIDTASCSISVITLKQRERGKITRPVPIPGQLIAYLEGVHGLRFAKLTPDIAAIPIWKWDRTTAWRKVKLVMQLADIPAYLAHPHTLRHTFATEAYNCDVPLEIIQELLGHADIRTTKIYARTLTTRLRNMAARTWPSIVESAEETIIHA